MTGDATPNLSKRLANTTHPDCFVCGIDHPFGLQLEFTLLEDGSVQASFACAETFAGYPGVLHGGVIASLLDGAMTNCLFAHGCQGVTGKLEIRFRHPLITDRDAVVRAWIDRSCSPYHVLKAELIQDEWVKAKATGTFADRPHPAVEWRDPP